jgi:hypothetical protein
MDTIKRYRDRSRDMPVIPRRHYQSSPQLGDKQNPATIPRGLTYPWHVWFSKSPNELTLHRWRDYNVRSYTMVQQVRNMASRPHWRLKVSCKVSPDEESITVRILGGME